MPRTIPPQRFGEKLRMLRHQHNLTQIDLAHDLGLSSHTHITNIEAGRRTPSLELVLQIAGRFHVTTESLLDDTRPLERLSLSRQIAQFVQPQPVPQLFGQKLRELRHQLNLTQTQLAHVLGLATHSHIANVEAGRRAPSLELVLMVADYFHVSVDLLVDDTASITPASGSDK